MSKQKQQVAQPASVRSTLSVMIPLILALIGSSAVGAGSQNNSVPLGIAGMASWLMGMLWFRYGPDGLGLRGGRPWLAGGGFAVIAWIFFIILRVIFVEIGDLATGGAGREFFYLLIFEAFAVHLWLFGLVFRSIADLRGGVTAALITGLLFAVVSFSTYSEIFVSSPTTFLFLITWGIFYGIVRLRTGSILGLVMIQPFQSLTTWFLLQPIENPPPSTLHSFYIAMAVVFLILIWRLWPKEQEDYRV